MTGPALHPLSPEFPRLSPGAPRQAASAGTELSVDVLRQLDLPIFVVDDEDTITYANDWARTHFATGTAGTAFSDLWADRSEDVHATLAAIAVAADWRGFTLTARAEANGEAHPVALRGRPFLVNRPPMLPQRYVLVTGDALGAEALALVLPPAEAEAREDVDSQRELIHRVKNNLALLMSLVRAARRNVSDQTADEEISGFERRLMSIAAMHDVLDAHRDTAMLRADDLVRRVCEGLGEALAPENVAIVHDLVPVDVPVASGSPLALIANELITNALKHGFPGGRAGEVAVVLRPLRAGGCELVIRDDGVGPEAAAAPGARRGSHGSGGSIVRALVVQLGGTLERLEQTRGTGWRLRFQG